MKLIKLPTSHGIMRALKPLLERPALTSPL